MSAQKHRRIFSIDIARGVFILLMLLSHSIHFFHTGSNPTFTVLRSIGDMLAFTGLLFISGAAAYHAYIHHRHPTQDTIKRLATRLSWYFLGYVLLGVVSAGYVLNPSWHTLWSVLTFQTISPFTEFLIPFLAIGILVIPLRGVFQRISASIIATALTSIVLYALGTWAYAVSVPQGLVWLKALFVGAEGWYTFPVFHYMPVYLWGIYVGRLLYEQKSQAYTTRLLRLYAWLFAIIATLFVVPGSLDPLMQRFPPHIAFLSIGIASALLTIHIIRRLRVLKDMPFTRTALTLFGQNTFAILFAHTIIIFIYRDVSIPLVHSTILTAVATLLSISYSLYIAKLLPFNYQLGLTVVRWCDCKIEHCTHAHEHRLVVHIKRLLMRALSVSDLLSIRIRRKKYSLISHGSGLLVASFLVLAAVPLGIAENTAYFDQTIGSLTGATNRTWYLVDRDETMTYTISIPQTLTGDQSVTSIRYKLEGHTPRAFDAVVESTYTASIDIQSLEPGSYALSTIVTLAGVGDIETQPTQISVSEPLYVTWTIDWEGFDVLDGHLDDMARISETYNIPMTHMFNPYIYINDDIAPERKAYLTNWLINRLDIYNEEVGLHLHMFPDFVRASGIAPKDEPRWGSSLKEGYDVPTSAYDADETQELLRYARALFRDNGLPQPVSFRAGGWFADEETLEALEREQFLVETSGRTSYTFGSSAMRGPWDLYPDAQPYFPSKSDQNNDGPPQFTVLEIPNNGADSYWFSAEDMITRFELNYPTKELSEAWYITYLSHPHWLDRENAEGKIEKVFEHISQHAYENDAGPVVFGTLLDVYDAVTNEEER